MDFNDDATTRESRPSFMNENSGFSKMVKNQDNDKEQMEEFFGSERNYIILSNSGKPIFSTHGDIYTLSSVYATLYAMVSKVQTFEFTTEIDGSVNKNEES